MGVLWYALFKGELCRIREKYNHRLVSEIWRNGSWIPGHDFAATDFTGRVISEEDARDWIQNHFRKGTVRSNSLSKT
jgi:hypothetical protein